MFLTDEQLTDLTGLRRPSAQVRWLTTRGIQHYVRVDGRPRVLFQALMAKSPDTQPEPRLRLPIPQKQPR